MTNNITRPDLTPSGTENINTLFDEFNFDSAVNDIVSGKFSVHTDGMINKIMKLVLGELHSGFELMGMLILLMLVCSVLNNLQDSFGRKSVSTAARFACFVYLAVIAAQVFDTSCRYVTQTLSDITVLMHSVIPTMSVMCVSGGNITLGTAMHPVIFFICSAMDIIIKNAVTPLVLMRGAAVLMFGINQNPGMNEIAGIFAKLHKTLLAFSMSIFAGLLGISRFASVSFDNLAARGIKFAINTSVPIVGGSVSEAMQSVAGSVTLLKNAVGITSVIMLFAMFAVPLIKLWALSFIYKITAAVAAPVADVKIIDTMKKTGECIDMMFSSVACMGVIMIIAIAAII